MALNAQKQREATKKLFQYLFIRIFCCQSDQRRGIHKNKQCIMKYLDYTRDDNVILSRRNHLFNKNVLQNT